MAGELSSGLGSGWGSRASWAAGERALGAQLSCYERLGREPPAQVLWGSGCAQPGEARKTTGEEGGSGRDGGRKGRGGRPQSARALRARAHSLGFSGPQRSEEKPASPDPAGQLPHPRSARPGMLREVG